jgi:hypothetical protein
VKHFMLISTTTNIYPLFLDGVKNDTNKKKELKIKHVSLY